MVQTRVMNPAVIPTMEPVVDVVIPKLELPSEDGIPLESSWHRDEINLLIASIRCHWRDRTDYYVAGNMFIYYSLQQARSREYRGPDFFVVKDVDGSYMRDSWIVWEEGGRYPDVIIELLSPSTAHQDKGVKKRLYERTFRTPEYYCYDPLSEELLGWRLSARGYVPIEPDPQGRLWSEELELWLGIWAGEYLQQHAHWLRFFEADGKLVLIADEAAQQRADAEQLRAEAERRRAEAERQRAEAAEAELARLRERLAALENGRS